MQTQRSVFAAVRIIHMVFAVALFSASVSHAAHAAQLSSADERRQNGFLPWWVVKEIIKYENGVLRDEIDRENYILNSSLVFNTGADRDSSDPGDLLDDMSADRREIGRPATAAGDALPAHAYSVNFNEPVPFTFMSCSGSEAAGTYQCTQQTGTRDLGLGIAVPVDPALRRAYFDSLHLDAEYAGEDWYDHEQAFLVFNQMVSDVVARENQRITAIYRQLYGVTLDPKIDSLKITGFVMHSDDAYQARDFGANRFMDSLLHAALAGDAASVSLSYRLADDTREHYLRNYAAPGEIPSSGALVPAVTHNGETENIRIGTGARPLGDTVPPAARPTLSFNSVTEDPLDDLSAARALRRGPAGADTFGNLRRALLNLNANESYLPVALELAEDLRFVNLHAGVPFAYLAGLVFGEGIDVAARGMLKLPANMNMLQYLQQLTKKLIANLLEAKFAILQSLLNALNQYQTEANRELVGNLIAHYVEYVNQTLLPLAKNAALVVPQAPQDPSVLSHAERIDAAAWLDWFRQIDEIAARVKVLTAQESDPAERQLLIRADDEYRKLMQIVKASSLSRDRRFGMTRVLSKLLAQMLGEFDANRTVHVSESQKSMSALIRLQPASARE